MKKIIIIKYGELSTKKDNINMFIKKLKENLEFSLKEENVDINYDKGRMFIDNINDYDNIISIIKNVFGIHEVNIAYKINTNEFNEVKESILCVLKEKSFNTFKVVTKRSNKKYDLNSMEISKEVGAFILNKIDNIGVDVHNPDIIINVEIRNTDAYFYFERIKGLGGYPVGSLGKGLLMLSGGIDSPVAGYYAMKRGIKLEAIYFDSPPHTSVQAKNKVIELSRKLALYNNDIKLHIIRLTELQESILKNIPNDYLITILRRMMYRISAIIAYNNNCHALINGESIGQVASQTLTSISCINSVVNIPVIRPLACFDKLEIIGVAKNIDTYETSIIPFEDCCTIFVPEHPVINPNKKTCEEYEKLINYEDLLYKAIKNHEIIKISNKEELNSIL